MNRRALVLLSVVLLASGVALVGAGCNGILGNEEGRLRVEDAAAPEAGAAIPAGVTCDKTQGNKLCFGLCVRIDDPATGCGGESCDACDPKNVTATASCGGNSDAGTLTCNYQSCEPGFGDCDSNRANGCETSLNAPQTCGGCSTNCTLGQGANLCALGAGGYGCVSECPSGTTNCDDACVDTMSSIENCGACRNKCARDGAKASCTEGKCTYTCKSGFHACGDACFQVTDPNHCGASCQACPAPPNTDPSCVGGQCQTTCKSGFLDCNKDPADGCEHQGSSCVSETECRPPCSLNQICCKGACFDSNDGTLNCLPQPPITPPH